jgi:iron complex outermembrane receptor protein
MGGVINIITRQPSNKTEGFVELNFGNYHQQRYAIGLRTPLVKNKVFFGISGIYNKRDGFYTNEFNNSSYDRQHSLTGNYYLKWLASSKWILTLNVKNHNNRNNGPFPLVFGTEPAFQKPFQLNQNAVAKMIDNTLNSSLSVSHAGAAFNFTSQTAYQSNLRYYDRPLDGDFSPLDGITIINNYGNDWNRVKVLTQEFRFTSSPSSQASLKWTAGTYFFYQDNPVKQATHFGEDAELLGAPDKNFSLINTNQGKSTGAALYGQFTYSFLDKLFLIAGLRYDYEKKKYTVLGEYQKAPDPVMVIRPDTSAQVNYHAISPKLGLSYNLSSKSNLYASYSQGFRAGGFTQLSIDPSQPPLYPYKPEYSNNVEAGIKNSLAGNRLRLNAVIFFTQVSHAQVPTLIIPDAITVTRNAGKLTSKGFEWEVESNPAKGLQVDYNFGYTDAKYKILKLSQGGNEVDLSGKRQIFTPDITSLLAAQYSYEIAPKHSLKLIVRGEWILVGKQYFDLANTIAQSSYSLINTRCGISTKHFGIFFWGRNLGNKKYIAYAYDFGAVHLGDPKTYGITLSGKF